MANLNQSEIDDLLNNIGVTAAATKAAEAKVVAPKKFAGAAANFDDEETVWTAVSHRNYRLYDFRRPEKLSKDQARQLKSHFGLFWRRVANYLANLSRSSVEMELVEVDQTSYKEIFVTHGVPMVMATFLLGGEYQGMMKIQLSQIFSLVDRLMGGNGICALRPRQLTEFERNLCIELFGQMLSFYAKLHGGATFEIEHLESDERLLPRKLSGDEMMIRAVYDIKIGSVGGFLSLYLPFKSLSEVVGSAAKASQVSRDVRLEDIPPVVSRLRLPVSVILGETMLPAEAVAKLKPGSVIKLQQEERRPLKVTIGGQARFTARPGLVGNRMAISILAKWGKEDDGKRF